MVDTNNSNNNDWEDFCLDPYQESLEQGKREGHEAGLKAGFEEGQVLGRTKGVEFGLELGYIRGFAEVVASLLLVLDSEDNADGSTTKDEPDRWDVAKKEKIVRHLGQLQKAIDDFPTSQDLFTKQAGQTNLPLSLRDLNISHDNKDDDSEQIASPQNSNSTDILGKIQRIRARFKLLTVQMGISKVTLKDIMDQAANLSARTDPGSGNVDESKLPASAADNEW